MSDRPATPQPPTEAGDAELIASVRAGNCAAYEVLYSRHRKAAAACARRFATREADVDDLVAEAFANVLDVLRKGAGPTEFFRAYLLRTIQHCAFRSSRQQRRTVLTDVWHSHEPAEPMRDAPAEAFDSRAVSEAFKSLPERWQAVLWHTEVEGEAPAVIGRLLGLRPNSVSALAYRAREGLRIAYIQAHITTMSDEACRKHAAKLGAYTRGKLNPTETARVREHLDNCQYCNGLYLELTDVSSSIRTAVVPLFLGPAVATYLLRTPGHAAQARLARVRHAAKFTGGKALIGTAAVGVVLGAGALTLTLSGGHQTTGHHTYAGKVGQSWAPGSEPSPSTSPGAPATSPTPPGTPSTSPTPPRQGPAADASTVTVTGPPGGTPEPAASSLRPARHVVPWPARVAGTPAAPTADPSDNPTGPATGPAPSSPTETASDGPSPSMSSEPAPPNPTPPPSQPTPPSPTPPPSQPTPPNPTPPPPQPSPLKATPPPPQTTATAIPTNCSAMELDSLPAIPGMYCPQTTRTRVLGSPLEDRMAVIVDRIQLPPTPSPPTGTPSPREPSVGPTAMRPSGTTKR
ncbi:sigma-70 family RNA polymerase sigma factor [Streptomyces sp. bgisy084]|uniref:sigma-70 family RNA polymerase sigma factor n=1 Tax=Streptomyces sp. bgisy084 TaxID=3413777 RepID=UPI003D72FE1F